MKNNMNMTQEDKYMKVHKTYFDIDMWGNPYEYEVEETVFFDEWADFDD